MAAEISQRDAQGRFVEGHSGNLLGRPPGATVYSTIKAMLGERSNPDDPESKTRMQVVADAWLAKMEEGDPAAVASVMNRETPLVQRVELDNAYDADTQAWLDALQGPEGEAAKARLLARATKNMSLPQGAPPPPEGPPNTLEREDGSLVDE